MLGIILIFKQLIFCKPNTFVIRNLLILLFIGWAVRMGAQTDSGTLVSKKRRTLKPEYSAIIGLKTMYNDNLLEYSDYFIEKFVTREDSGRFHINTYDALLIKPSFLFTISLPLFKKKPTQLWGYAAHTFTIRNNKRGDFSSYSFGLNQTISPAIQAELSYSYLPFFYLFHMRDRDYTDLMGFTPETFMPLTYSKNKYEAGVSYKWKTIKLNFTGLRSQYFFNAYFTEFDAIEQGYRVNISSRFFKQKLSTKFLYEFSRSMAKGYDEEGETRLNSDESDASNYRNRYGVQLDYSIPKIRKVATSLSLEIDITKRTYLSENFIERDMFQTGRRDIVANLGVDYKISISKHMVLALTYEHNKRKAGSLSSINHALIDRERSYSQNVYGMAINYKISSAKKKQNSKKNSAKSKSRNPKTKNNNHLK
jgi:hypothetical protein